MNENNTLENLRKEISEIDREVDETLGKLLERRTEIGRKIARIKAENGQSIVDPAREKEVLSSAEFPEMREFFMNRTKAAEAGVYGLLGRGISYSLSPEIHKELGNYIGLPYSYELFDIEENELETFLKKGQFDAVNVTKPYKEKVIPYLDEIDSAAAETGAVNLIVRRGEKLIGYNTDTRGFKRALEYEKVLSGITFGKPLAAVFGKGGASKAVQYVLSQYGFDTVVLSARESRDLSDFSGVSVIVNATPLGQGEYENESPVSFEILSELKQSGTLKAVIDLNYNPLRTRLILDAKRAGIKYMSGLSMLAFQAAEAARIFLGENNKISEKDGLKLISCSVKIAEKLRRQRENLVIIGMPGAGKTTLSRKLGRELDLLVIDIDLNITKSLKMTPSDIIMTLGEEAFRNLESSVIRDVLKPQPSLKGPFVIDCGGGVVVREENYYNLAKNGKVIFLDVPKDELNSLPTENRPLSEEKSVETIYDERISAYRSWADVIISRISDK